MNELNDKDYCIPKSYEEWCKVYKELIVGCDINVNVSNIMYEQFPGIIYDGKLDMILGYKGHLYNSPNAQELSVDEFLGKVGLSINPFEPNINVLRFKFQ